MCFLANNTLNIVYELGLGESPSILTHHLDEKSFEMRYVNAQGVDKNREVWIASAPYRVVVLNVVKIKPELANRKIIHWVDRLLSTFCARVDLSGQVAVSCSAECSFIGLSNHLVTVFANDCHVSVACLQSRVNDGV